MPPRTDAHVPAQRPSPASAGKHRRSRQEDAAYIFAITASMSGSRTDRSTSG